MKVLVVCQYFYPEQVRLNDICKELVLRGHDVTVLTGLPNYPVGVVFDDYKHGKNRNQIVDGIKIIRSSLVGRGSTTARMMVNYLWFGIFGSLKARTISEDFDVVYVYQLSPVTMAWPGITVKRRKKIPLVLHSFDLWPISIATGGVSKRSLVYKIIGKISRNIYRNADVIACSSLPFKDYFVSELHLPNDKGFVYLPSYAESDYMQAPTVDNGVFDLLFAGNIGPALSVETIIEAARILKNNDKIRFHIVGDGLSRNKCERLAVDYGLNNVKFYGQHPLLEMRQYYELADAFLVTMVDNEVVNGTLPAKVQSYMAAGKPIIGAVSGEAMRVIKEAECGLCCRSLDHNGLAQMIEEASVSSRIPAWSENAYRYYIDHFDKKKCMDDLEKVLKDACASD